jgi:hypothetical protein
MAQHFLIDILIDAKDNVLRGWPQSSITEIPREGIIRLLQPPAHTPSPLPPPAILRVLG